MTAALPLTKIIPSYVYVQYADDLNVQGFVSAYNNLAQQYLDYFNGLNLPIYTLQSGAFLDWVGQGLYNQVRPALPQGVSFSDGPYNTYAYNEEAYNGSRTIGPSSFYVTTDDIYRRIITWNFYKGDGYVFSVRWLKRRIQRFLFGSTKVDQTYQISITFSLGNSITIRINQFGRQVVGGAIYNCTGMNRVGFNRVKTIYTPPQPVPLAAIFKSALMSGALQFPFQFNVTINI